MVINSKLADGLCAIDVVAKQDIVFDTATSYEIAEAATVLLDKCVKGLQNQGGVAGKLGFDEGLAVRIVPYKARISCSDDPDKKAPPPGSCRHVLDWMPATYDRQLFGPRNAEGVEVGLPRGFMVRELTPNRTIVS